MIPEKEREALQRLTMCARHDCKICKYKDKYTFEDCDNEITDNMHILFEALDSAEPKDWIEQNKDRILQAGKEGREVEFRIGGRLFAIREKAQ